MNTDKLKQLKKGMTFKNYKILCEFLGEKIKGGSSKTKQLKEWECYFDFKKRNNQSIEILRVFKPQTVVKNFKKLKDIKKRKSNRHKTLIAKFFKCKKSLYDMPGVYIIQLNNDVYIGSTIKFWRRFNEHRRETNDLPTLQLMKDGATFTPLWIYDKQEGEKLTDEEIEIIRKKEVEYINKYIQEGKYNVLNVQRGIKKNFKSIKVSEKDYNKAIDLLKKEKIYIKE